MSKRLVVLQGGVAKSGNYWLWKIINSILVESGIGTSSHLKQHSIQQSLTENADLTHENQNETDVVDIENGQLYWRVSSLYKEKIVDVEAYTQKATHIWTHSEWDEGFSQLLPYADKVIYIIRDPRDISISMSHFAFTPYMMKHSPNTESDQASYLANRIEWQTRNWREHVSGWLASRPANTHFVFYERLKNDFDSELIGILQFLEIELTDEQFSTVKRQVSVKEMTKNNPGHVRTLKKKHWSEVLTIEQQKTVESVAGELLMQLGYPPYGDDFRDLELATKDAAAKIYKSQKYSMSDYLRGLIALLFGKRPIGSKVKVIKKELRSLRRRVLSSKK